MKDFIKYCIWVSLLISGVFLLIHAMNTDGVQSLMAISSGALFGFWFIWTWELLHK